MSKEIVPTSVLTAAELGALALWQADLQGIAQKSKSVFVRRFSPRLAVSPRDGVTAYTEAWTVFVHRAALIQPPVLRSYFLAHELGHLEALHGVKSMAAGAMLAISFGGLLVSALRQEWVSALCLSTAGVSSYLLIQAYSKTMLFEWVADRRGAQMTDVQAMVDGIDAVRALRPDTDAPFYESKRAKLLGHWTSFLGIDERR